MSDGPMADAFAYSGGAVLALCLLPQVYQILQTACADDIAYGWTGLYVIGMGLSLIYLILINAVAGWTCLLVELVLAMIMVLQKVTLQLGWWGTHNKKNKKRDTRPLRASIFEIPNFQAHTPGPEESDNSDDKPAAGTKLDTIEEALGNAPVSDFMLETGTMEHSTIPTSSYLLASGNIETT